MEMKNKKVYTSVDEIITVLRNNNIDAVEYDENCEDCSDNRYDIVYIIDINTNDHKAKFFDDINKDREDELKYNICLLYNSNQFFRNTKNFTEAYLLSIINKECNICYEMENNDIQCQTCSKRICIQCINKILNNDNINNMYIPTDMKCPICKNNICPL